MPFDVSAILNYAAGGGTLLILGGLIRWGIRVDHGLTNTVHATELLAERIKGHELLDLTRHTATADALERLERIALASEGRRQYTQPQLHKPLAREGEREDGTDNP